MFIIERGGYISYSNRIYCETFFDFFLEIFCCEVHRKFYFEKRIEKLGSDIIL